MELANYRSIPPELIDIALSKTQRKTPTEIHKNFDIVRIRKFYMRKVKFTQETFHLKFDKLIEGFPKVETIHPFFADLINVLYDRDHYKIALGRAKLAQSLIDRTSREYIRLLKYGDSLFRCKALKRIALGRMVSIVRKLDKFLVYLEQVRQHMSRLPGINPAARLIVLCGFPNVGKSSFLNYVSRADVEVEPYPFTTKSLYVGQTDYNYLRFQVIDTPGVLDQPLEGRNTVEMQAITAMAHLRATILFLIDVSETCGYSLKEQFNLFQSLQPLFKDKPVIIGLNKIDVLPISSLSQESKDTISKFNAPCIPLSTLTGENVMELRNAACDLVLAQRQEAMTKSGKLETLSKRLYVAIPQPRDDVHRPPYIPKPLKDDVLSGAYKPTTPSQNDLFLQNEEDYQFDERKQYFVPDDEKYDIIPEIINGKNIADFVDPDLPRRLLELEEEERILDSQGFYNIPKWSHHDIKAHYDKIYIDEKRRNKMAENSLKKSSKMRVPRPIAVKVKKFKDRVGKQNDINMDIESEIEESHEPEVKSYSESFNSKLTDSGVAKTKLKKCIKLKRHSQMKNNLSARAGDSDRRIYNLKPRHLFSGKRKQGKTQRR